MIDISLYRRRIGLFCGGGGDRLGSKLKDQSNNQYEDYKSSVFSPTNMPHSTKFNLYNQSSMELEENVVHKNSYFIHSNLFMLLYLYTILIFTMITSYFVCSPDFNIAISYNICPGVVYLKWDLSFITISQIKIAFFYLMFYVLLRTTCSTKKWPKNAIFSFAKCSRLVRILSNMVLCIIALNFLLIGIVNPSMLNPGPSSLKVYYQNVQGLIPFSDLDNQQPRLNMTKIYEINTYVQNTNLKLLC